MRVLPSYIGRAAALWLLVRLALLAAGSAGAGLSAAAIDPSRYGQAPPGFLAGLVLAPPAMLLAAATVTALVYVDMAALRERAFIANLGVDRRQVGVTALLTALALEVAVAAMAGVLA